LIRVFIFIFAILFSANAYEFDTKSFPDEFYNIKDSQQKKEEFIRVMLPIIEHQNSQILKERELVKKFFSKEFFITADKKMNKEILQELSQIAKKYDIDNLFDKKAYLNKIDVIPNSMALAQAALESGWGSSQYAKELNNLYGQYTFRKNIEALRVEGKKEKIRIFSSLDNAVKQYMLNLNSHWAYEKFREKRAELRALGLDFNGLDGIKHLTKYSEIGKSYIRKLKSVMATNNLVIYDKFYPEISPNKYLLSSIF